MLKIGQKVQILLEVYKTRIKNSQQIRRMEIEFSVFNNIKFKIPTNLGAYFWYISIALSLMNKNSVFLIKTQSGVLQGAQILFY